MDMDMYGEFDFLFKKSLLEELEKLNNELKIDKSIDINNKQFKKEFKEVQKHAIMALINGALENKDEELFIKLTEQLRSL